MKKRIAGALLALLLAASACPALGADVPLEVKFINQVKESAYRAAVTFSAEGDATAALPEELWARILAAAPRLTLTGSHGKQRGEGQAEIALMIDGECAGRTVALYNGELTAFASDLIAGAECFYAFPSGWGGGASGAALRMLSAVWSAPEDWRKKAAPYFREIETDLEIWVNTYTEYAVGTENGQDYTELASVLPPEAVRAQAGRIVDRVFGSEALLKLLREIAPKTALPWLEDRAAGAWKLAAAALEPGGSVTVRRRYDDRGNPLLDEISLPLGGGRAVLTARPAADGGQEWGLLLTGEETGELFVTCAPAQDNASCRGEIRFRPLRGEAVGFTYALAWEASDEEYSLSTDKFEKTVSGRLLLTPEEGAGLPAMSLTLEAKFASGSRQTSPTRLDGTLTWRDEDSGAQITAALESKTAAPFDILHLSEVEDAVRLDEMERDDLASLPLRWLESGQEWLEGAAEKIAR